MGGTLQPPTMSEIEAENRQLKQQLRDIVKNIKKLLQKPKGAATLETLEELIEFIEPSKKEIAQLENENLKEKWNSVLLMRELVIK